MDITKSDLTAIQKQADRMDVALSALLAVIEVESDGKVYELVKGRLEPLIRWEGHYFDKLLSGDKLKRARAEGLAHPTAGKIKNPVSQAKRYEILERAKKIDAEAAMMSCSWGVGQVMGAHWDDLGFPSVQSLVDKARSGFAGQVEIMCAYITHNKLDDELRRFDWAGFARGYNGPAYQKYGYDFKMQVAYERRSGQTTPVSSASGMLRMGSKGAGVRELQTLLGRAGYTIKVDGDFGPTTRDAVKGFQAYNHLRTDGVAGPETMKALLAYKTSPDEALGKVPLTENADVKNGAAGLLGGVSAATIAGQLNDIADKIGTTGIAFIDHAVQALYITSGILIVGGVLWGVYGHFKSRTTFEGAS